jgi:hypothetical protein
VAEPVSEHHTPAVADCPLCGQTYLVLSADDYADLQRAHVCEGQISFSRDLLRRLLLAAESGDVVGVMELRREITMRARWSPDA